MIRALLLVSLSHCAGKVGMSSRLLGVLQRVVICGASAGQFCMCYASVECILSSKNGPFSLCLCVKGGEIPWCAERASAHKCCCPASLIETLSNVCDRPVLSNTCDRPVKQSVLA